MSRLTWYIARSSGLVDWLLMAASIVWGLVLSTRLIKRRGLPAWLLSLHRYLGNLAMVFLAVHVVALSVDTYVPFGPKELFVPLASTWRPGAVAWGIVSMYLLLAIQLTSWMMKRLPKVWWRRIHHTSAVVFVAATVHGFTAGADGANPVVQWGALVVGALVAFLVLVRVLADRRPTRVPVRTPQQQPESALVSAGE